jgi:hypothetical protein
MIENGYRKSLASLNNDRTGTRAFHYPGEYLSISAVQNLTAIFAKINFSIERH